MKKLESHVFQKDAQEGSLLQWLERRGIELDTRCGRRGLCQGCRVLIDGEERRSCQVSTQDLREGAEVIPQVVSSGKKVLHALDSFSMDWKASAGNEGMGLAIDIGTTTVVVALWDLKKGVLLDTSSSGNAQRRYGDNVLTRVQHELDGGGDDLHQALVEENLKPLVKKLLGKHSGSAEMLKRVIVAGNPVMLHTMLNLSLEGFASYPFNPHFLASRKVSAELLGLFGEIEVNLLPGMGAFVGADIVAGALSSGMIDGGEKVLLIDFGTNGEILLKNGDSWVATATAVGPAFEGGSLTCGRPADVHSIHHLDYVDGKWLLIGDQEDAAEYKGFSGSAYIDYISLCLQQGWLTERGRYENDVPGVEVKELNIIGKVLRHLLADKIYISETDLAELLKAKAAIQAGAEALLEEAGLDVSDLDQVIVAGGFGYHMNLQHAMNLGLLPRVEISKVKIVGNASLGGASRVLLDEGLLPSLEKLSSKTKVVELNLLDSFEDLYLDALTFIPEED